MSVTAARASSAVSRLALKATPVVGPARGPTHRRAVSQSSAVTATPASADQQRAANSVSPSRRSLSMMR